MHGGIFMDDLLSSAFELPGLQDISTVFDESESAIVLKGTQTGLLRCPRCHSEHLHRHTKKDRTLLLPPIGDKPVRAQISLQKQFCVACKHTWWPKMSFASGKEQMTKSFKSHALSLLKFGTIKDVSLHLGVGWDTIKAIHKNHLQDLYQEVDMSEVEYISIDEFSIAKGHKYMTIIMEIKTGRILEAIEGRKVKDISSALERLKKKHPNLKVLRLT